MAATYKVTGCQGLQCGETSALRPRTLVAAHWWTSPSASSSCSVSYLSPALPRLVLSPPPALSHQSGVPGSYSHTISWGSGVIVPALEQLRSVMYAEWQAIKTRAFCVLFSMLQTKKWKRQERMSERGSVAAAMTGWCLRNVRLFFLVIKKIIKTTLGEYFPPEILLRDLAKKPISPRTICCFEF